MGTGDLGAQRRQAQGDVQLRPWFACVGFVCDTGEESEGRRAVCALFTVALEGARPCGVPAGLGDSLSLGSCEI